ncbi:MAG: RecQ family ATP-dependent DNA helicase [Acidobacteria bacterium]|nr:RecQ family ATP-dependent DNA helicase [Acidobacteriota bacterium]
MPTFDDAQSALEQHFSFSSFREGQADVIRAVMDGRDCVVVMPTGGGKSLCYQLPSLLFPGVTLVVSPLIALMKDQVDALNARQIPATVINSSINFDQQMSRLRAMADGQFRLVYVAPERFRNERFVEALKAVKVSLFAVDEAHCISQWGHDFRPDYLRLRSAIEALGQDGGKRPQVIALTATATPKVRDDIAAQLGLRNPASFIAGFDRPNLMLRILPCKTDKERIARAAQIIERSDGTGIIYTSTRKAVEEVTSQLQSLKLKAAGYHAGLGETVRARVQDSFMSGQLQAIVATNAFGMGVDKRDLRFVTHYNLPGSIEAYYQEVGRAGRDGLPSVCTLLFNYSDTRTHEFFIGGNFPTPDLIRDVYDCLKGVDSETVELTAREIAPRIGVRNEMAINSALVCLEKAGHIERAQAGSGIKLLDRVSRMALRVDWTDLAKRRAAEERKLREMVNYAYHENCLRQFVLRYFGDRKQVANCRCSNCQPRMMWKDIEEAVEERHQRIANSSASIQPIESGGARALTDAEHLVVRKILSCVARMEGRFGKSVVAGVLRGSRAKNIHANQLDQLSTYGLLREYTQDDLTRFINTLIVAGCIRQSGTAYPVVTLTELGRQVMLDKLRVELDLEAVGADLSEEISEEAEAAEIQKSLPKNRLGDTHLKTFELYRQGFNADEIANQRGLKTSTIEEHLSLLIEAGQEINLDRLVDAADRALIEAAAEQCAEAGQVGLTPIKQLLPEQISYGAIRITLAALRARKPEQNGER